MEKPLLAVATQDGESELKDYIIEYVGSKFEKEDVTVQMIAETLASEFPDFLFAVAEENFIRGYQVGIDDGTTLANKDKLLGKADEQKNDWATTSQGELHDGSTE